MNQLIKNAKKVFSKAVLSVSCWLEINRAVVSYLRAEACFKKLHPVRQARLREMAGYKMRACEVAYEVAVKHLKTI
ncbi:hypothetical protein ACI77O_13145 [Pseudomonas tritici]|uniref:hypothetical protein n=1 Tax=Pseudomonas tritici TaxID=2745518 RepID=UPI00387AFF0C